VRIGGKLDFPASHPMPSKIFEKLNKAINTGLTDPKVSERLASERSAMA
jgi:hypothetical protein